MRALPPDRLLMGELPLRVAGRPISERQDYYFGMPKLVDMKMGKLISHNG